ncbi:hypothetical protein ABZ897_05660 [Nonomuraea sp. NPDC046802]|uniref:hypothetical protein n=1 Tax=Nonomuraea sp. NPDC046802 TaxID=3154919 RepID=UPI00340464CE
MTTTRIPRAARRDAVAAPIPLLAPVTNATLPVVTGPPLLVIAGRRHDRQESPPAPAPEPVGHRVHLLLHVLTQHRIARPVAS